MAISDDITACLNEEAGQVLRPLQREGYVRRRVFREGDAPQQVIIRDIMQRPHGTPSEIQTDRDFCLARWAVMLGSAGAGKSAFISYVFVTAAHEWEASKPVPLLLDLDQDVGSPPDLRRALDTRYRGIFSRIAAEHRAGAYLLLDSLDNRIVASSPKFVQSLREFLVEHQSSIAGCLIGCRRSVYRDEWLRGLSFDIYQIDYLGDEEYRQIIVDEDQLSRFQQQCYRLQIVDLLSTPFDGFYLARRFLKAGTLPSTRRECLEQRIADGIKGTTIDTQHGTAPPQAELHALAELLACAATFMKKGHWTAQEAVDLLGDSALGRERTLTTPEKVRTLLDRPLFSRSRDSFRFSHQIFQEFLVAHVLDRLPLRKQLQLLGTALPGSHRISTPYRGVAAFLCEGSPSFFDHVLCHDPLIALFAENTGLTPEQNEQLLAAVIDQAVSESRFPWWPIPPHGNSPLPLVARFRPRDIAGFLGRYFNGDRTSHLWATACAEQWSGDTRLNTDLVKVALDGTEFIQTRRDAIAAVEGNGDRRALRDLSSLVMDADDAVASHALRMYRQIQRPSPAAYIAVLRALPRPRTASSYFQREGREFGDSVSAEDVSDALKVLATEWRALDKIAGHMLDGLLATAAKAQSDDVPTDLLLACLAASVPGHAFYEDSLVELLRSRPTIVWKLFVEAMHQLSSDMASHLWHKADLFAELGGEALLDMVPPWGTLPGNSQYFVSRVCYSLFSREPSFERLERFKAKAAGYVHDAWMPQHRERPSGRDMLSEKETLLNAIASETSALAQAWHVLKAVEHIERRGTPPSSVVDRALAVISRQSRYIEPRMLDLFRRCVADVRYFTEWHDDGIKAKATATWLATPFLVLWEMGERFSADKVSEFAVWYAHNIQSEDGRQRLDSLLAYLASVDIGVWRACLTAIADYGCNATHYALSVLGETRDRAYEGQCRLALQAPQNIRSYLSDLVLYWRIIHPPDYDDVLRQCYDVLSATPDAEIAHGQRDQARFSALLLMMAENHDWAWTEFRRLFRSEQLPSNLPVEHLQWFSAVAVREHLPLIAEVYGWMLANQPRDDSTRAHTVLDLLASADEPAALVELRRVATTLPRDKKAESAYGLLQVEDRLLDTAVPPQQSGILIDYILGQEFGILRDDRDLFEVVCQAIEAIQEELETRGEGVAAFWNGDEPKAEPDCQNVLWPRLRDKLARLGVSDVEERHIGPNKVDWWIEIQSRTNPPLRVALELKTARKRYGKSRLVEPIETQLWEQYLKPTNCRFGIFVVLWFRDPTRYDYPTQWQSASSLRKDVKFQCASIEQAEAVTLSGVVVDLTAPYRTR